MKKFFKYAVFAVLILLICALLVNITLTLKNLEIFNSGKEQAKEYYQLDLLSSNDKHSQCEQVLADFGLSQLPAGSIKAAELTATSDKAVLLVWMHAYNKTEFADNARLEMQRLYPALKYNSASNIVSYYSVDMKQLWQMTGEDSRITMYKLTSSGIYTSSNMMMSISLPIDRFELAK